MIPQISKVADKINQCILELLMAEYEILHQLSKSPSERKEELKRILFAEYDFASNTLH